jgi:hypothetical protein
MENLGKTNGSEPVSVEVVSKVDEILSDFFGKLDKAVQSWLKQNGIDPDAPSLSELDGRLAELNERVDSVEENDPHEVAVGVVEENGEGFLREDDLPDQILNHVGETLDKDQIVELIKETIAGQTAVHTAEGVVKLVKRTLADAMDDAEVVVEPPVSLYGKVKFPEGYGDE